MELMETFIQLDTRDTERLKLAVRLELCRLPDLAVEVALRDLPRGRGVPLALVFSSIVTVFVARKASVVPRRLLSMVSMWLILV